MTPEEIKANCDVAYLQIKLAESKLKEMREICKHENTFIGLYSWRVGTTQQANICSDCGKCINIIGL